MSLLYERIKSLNLSKLILFFKISCYLYIHQGFIFIEWEEKLNNSKLIKELMKKSASVVFIHRFLKHKSNLNLVSPQFQHLN